MYFFVVLVVYLYWYVGVQCGDCLWYVGVECMCVLVVFDYQYVQWVVMVGEVLVWWCNGGDFCMYWVVDEFFVLGEGVWEVGQQLVCIV